MLNSGHETMHRRPMHQQASQPGLLLQALQAVAAHRRSAATPAGYAGSSRPVLGQDRRHRRLLGMARGERPRGVWAGPLGRGKPLCLSGGMATPGRSRTGGTTTRPSVPQPGMLQPGAHGARDHAREHPSGQTKQRYPLGDDPRMHEGAPVFAREPVCLTYDGRTNMSNLHEGASEKL